MTFVAEDVNIRLDRRSDFVKAGLSVELNVEALDIGDVSAIVQEGLAVRSPTKGPKRWVDAVRQQASARNVENAQLGPFGARGRQTKNHVLAVPRREKTLDDRCDAGLVSRGIEQELFLAIPPFPEVQFADIFATERFLIEDTAVL